MDATGRVCVCLSVFSVSTLMERRPVPAGVLNYLLLLGWSYKPPAANIASSPQAISSEGCAAGEVRASDSPADSQTTSAKEMFSLPEMVANFALDRVHAANAVVGDKLEHFLTLH